MCVHTNDYVYTIHYMYSHSHSLLFLGFFVVAKMFCSMLIVVATLFSFFHLLFRF